MTNPLKEMTSDERQGEAGEVVQLSHGETYYELDGDADQPLVICIHGWSTSSYVWQSLKAEFRAMNYRVLTFDMYGRGFSSRPENVDYTPSFLTDQLNELLAKLNLNNARASIVGYSMGGAIAARYVSNLCDQQLANRVERLLLIAPAGMKVRSEWLRKRLGKYGLLDSAVRALMPLVLKLEFKRSAKGFKDKAFVKDVLHHQLRELDYKGYIPALFSSLKGIVALEMEREHRTISESGIPTRAVFASNDKTILTDKSKKLFDKWHSNNDAIVIPGPGHALPYTHPELVMEKVTDFF